jgi:hypothetical protein
MVWYSPSKVLRVGLWGWNGYATRIEQTMAGTKVAGDGMLD